MCPRLTAGEIDLMISQFHRKECCDGVRRCLRTAKLTELLKTAVVMRYQLACSARAVEIMPVMTADDQPVGRQPVKTTKIVIIMGKHIAIRFAKAD